MKKEFVPYELAVKLKELGFDEDCLARYEGKITHIEKPLVFEFTFANLPGAQNKVGYPNYPYKDVEAPTFSQAFRWFREKYQIFPEVLTDCTTEPKFVFTYNKFFGNPKDLTEQEWGWENNIGQYSDIYRTYEDAELACLEKLIEIIKK